mgnify:CR=1 FL=1
MTTSSIRFSVTQIYYFKYLLINCLANVDQNIDAKKQLILELRKKMDSYFRIAVRGLKDLVPKVVGNFYIRWF